MRRRVEERRECGGEGRGQGRRLRGRPALRQFRGKLCAGGRAPAPAPTRRRTPHRAPDPAASPRPPASRPHTRRCGPARARDLPRGGADGGPAGWGFCGARCGAGQTAAPPQDAARGPGLGGPGWGAPSASGTWARARAPSRPGRAPPPRRRPAEDGGGARLPTRRTLRPPRPPPALPLLTGRRGCAGGWGGGSGSRPRGLSRCAEARRESPGRVSVRGAGRPAGSAAGHAGRSGAGAGVRGRAVGGGCRPGPWA